MNDKEKVSRSSSYVFSKQYYNNQFYVCPNRIIECIGQSFSKANQIVDFGCGHGIKAISMALKFPDKQVIGIDITNAFNKAEEFVDTQLQIKFPDNLTFIKIAPGQSLKNIACPDIIYSWSVFEHISHNILSTVISDMHKSMQTNGTIFTQIAPLYYSPYGSHLREYIDDPWAHLSLTDSTLKRLVLEKPLGKTDQIRAKWMHDQYMQLNKITAMELENLFIEAGFKFDTKKIFETSITPHKNLLEIFNKKTLTTYELIYVVKKLI